MAYLLKVTLAWALFLLLFEVFYKSNGKFTINRVYLLCSIIAGLLLPLIPLPAGALAIVSSATQTFSPIVAAPEQAPAIVAPAATAVAATATAYNPDIWLMLRLLYAIGIGCLSMKLLLESGKIIRLILRHPHHLIDGHKVIVTGKCHAPYSFMGWIFISDLDAYQPAELAYVIRHEAAHNYKKHWLDLLLLQSGCIVLWFHPLIWRYRYLLRLQHEYEADYSAASDNAYDYGHFLLQQTLLNGVPSIAHSFHFSPIKNRIKMLTKRHNQRPGAWKYLLVIPALLGCTFLMARSAATMERVRQGNITTFNGNTFTWHTTDTFFYDQKRKYDLIQVIYKMNDKFVYENEKLIKPASFGNTENAYNNYIQKEFSKVSRNTRDSATVVTVSNLVVNEQGKIVYYETWYNKPYMHFLYQNNFWRPYPDRDPALDLLLNKIIANSPAWKPAMVNGQPVNSAVNFRGGGC